MSCAESARPESACPGGISKRAPTFRSHNASSSLASAIFYIYARPYAMHKLVMSSDVRGMCMENLSLTVDGAALGFDVYSNMFRI